MSAHRQLRLALVAGATVFACAAVACDKKSDDAVAGGNSPVLPAGSTMSAPSASMAEPSMPLLSVATPGVPSHADEAVAASKEITRSNYKWKLDEIERELR